MATDVGLKVGIEGEKQFKSALSDMNRSFKVLGSEMKLVTSEFDKNDKSVTALSAKNEVLNKSIEAQKSKILTLESALKNASDSFGENDKRTQNWAVQLNNAKAELNNMERELASSGTAADKMGDELSDSGDAAEESKGKFEGLSGVLKGMGAAMGAVVIAAAATSVALVKSVLSAYSDYEQLVGGVDTLFQESSGKLQEYAANAYKTAGLSANDYMETVTSFSASLIQSLGGDTKKAAEYADMAITDMSDNANKMGSDMGSIQDAYQGFAKQNYTMLDNLKLGYGGTKTEMERLLADASAISGITYDVSSYADVVSAIHVIQDSMGIAGTTAKEAEETIAGSLSSFQSAWGNLVAGLGNSDADIGMLTGNLVGAFQNVVKNITPIIQNLVEALPTAIDAMVVAAGTLLPTLLTAISSLFTQVVASISGMLPGLIPTVVEAVLTIVSALVENLPLLMDGAVQLVVALALGIGAALPKLIPEAVKAVMAIVNGLIDNIDLLIPAALTLIVGLAAGLIRAIPQLIAAGPKIISGIVKGLKDSIGPIKDVGKNIIEGLWSGISSMVTWIKDKVSGFLSGIVSDVKGLLGIHSPSTVFAGIGKNMGAGIGVGFTEAMDAAEKDMQKAIPTSFDDLNVSAKMAVDAKSVTGGLLSSGANVSSAILEALQTIAKNGEHIIVLSDGTLVGKLAPKLNRELALLARRG
jgi:phage-related protein